MQDWPADIRRDNFGSSRRPCLGRCFNTVSDDQIMISSPSLHPEPDSNAVQKKPASVIGMEQQWRCPDGGDVDAQQQGKILVSRWTCNAARPLEVAKSDDAVLGKVFTDGVGLAIVSRVVGRHFTVGRRQTREALALPSWRLSRAVEYVDAHLSDSIGLEDIARSAGLTRMHFASQFRRATGLRPHEYLLRRRIEHAQRLLLDSRHNVLDVALSCGFRTQAHFTTVFKRFVGETPHCWRKKTNVER
jgi:AraC-like DNA-binding protein